ncbi:hypothetical protein EVAR_42722_1 [Eumeta japonica]|uniref:Uncharacterized protein n=1 Tax=Eumeta variegata TaxID=151549 RepID=A0A4C1XHM8_EUMVA|nr:hypothetical protein EVAR_42722_1 [Eumeta japonica]
MKPYVLSSVPCALNTCALVELAPGEKETEQDFQIAVKILRLTRNYVRNLMKESGAAVVATIGYTSFTTGIDTCFMIVNSGKARVSLFHL